MLQNLNFFLGKPFPKPEDKKLPKKLFLVCELIWVTGKNNKKRVRGQNGKFFKQEQF